MQKLLVVRVVVKAMEASRQSKIGKLDVSAPIKQDVVRLDVTGIKLDAIP